MEVPPSKHYHDLCDRLENLLAARSLPSSKIVPTSNLQTTSTQLDSDTHPNGDLKPNKIYDITMCYISDTASVVAK